ncbi:MAG: hypothetical protein V9G20_28785 [Candidatus Promineifilaceae bacterium]
MIKFYRHGSGQLYKFVGRLGKGCVSNELNNCHSQLPQWVGVGQVGLASHLFTLASSPTWLTLVADEALVGQVGEATGRTSWGDQSIFPPVAPPL